MKTINLYLKFHFTSLSPDAQPISLGIVSDDKIKNHLPVGVVGFNKDNARMQARTHNLNPDNRHECILIYRPEHFRGYDFRDIIQPNGVASYLRKDALSDEMQTALDIALKTQVVKEEELGIRQFYARFSDYDEARCDQWVKDNVVAKKEICNTDGCHCFGNKSAIRHYLNDWLSLFKDYQIQFIVDCGAYNWTHLLELIAEWNEVDLSESESSRHECPLCKGYVHSSNVGLPKLPSNISPVPLDLNDLIAFKYRVNAAEAFNVDRFKMANADEANKYHALFDAMVIKDCYNKLY